MTQKWLHSHPARGENHLPIGRSQPGSVNSPCPDAFLTATSGFSASWIGANCPGAASGGRVAAVPSLPSVWIPRTDRTPFPDSRSGPSHRDPGFPLPLCAATCTPDCSSFGFASQSAIASLFLLSSFWSHVFYQFYLSSFFHKFIVLL